VIDAMTLAEAGEIFAYWEENPPPHLMLQTIARMLGWMPRSASAAVPQIADIAAAPPPGVAVVHGGEIGMPPPLDHDALLTRNRLRAVAIARRNRSAGC
jgi:hypothetical protein